MSAAVAAIDVPCPDCNARAGSACRAWHWLASATPRPHRARSKLRRLTIEMHALVALLALGGWPTEAEVELLAKLGEGDDQERATKLLGLIEATGYDGELF